MGSASNSIANKVFKACFLRYVFIPQLFGQIWFDALIFWTCRQSQIMAQPMLSISRIKIKCHFCSNLYLFIYLLMVKEKSSCKVSAWGWGALVVQFHRRKQCEMEPFLPKVYLITTQNHFMSNQNPISCVYFSVTRHTQIRSEETLGQRIKARPDQLARVALRQPSQEEKERVTACDDRCSPANRLVQHHWLMKRREIRTTCMCRANLRQRAKVLICFC